jgi:hypothetical protein
MAARRNFHEVLGVPRDADAKTITRVRSAGSPAAITRTPVPTAIGELPPRHRLVVYGPT